MTTDSPSEGGAHQFGAEYLCVWRELVSMIIEWEDSCEPADVLAREIISKYGLFPSLGQQRDGYLVRP
jgi:hypothetical protein